MESQNEAILKRLEKLERENRRLRRWGLAALAAVAALGILGAAGPTPDAITAHSFVLTDAAGNMRGKWTAVEGKVPSLTLYDAKGKTMLSLTGGGPLPGLAIADLTGEMRVRLGGLSPNLAFYDNAGNTTLSLDGDSLGPRLLLFDAAGKMKVHLGGPGPSMDLMDGHGNEIDIGVTDAMSSVAHEVRRTTAASIVMFGRDEENNRKILWRAP
jgi:hypothetical protein